MKQTIRLLLAVLTLGMCSINGSAQNKKDIDCDSVRVLEWEQCSVCMGSGSCPVCKKYGKRYEGTKLTTCPECLGDGRCRHCFGKGGDHYYVWKYSKSEKSAEVSATDDASQFVTITDVVPDVILEIRYFGTYNFVGTRIDGYEEPTALLTKQAANSLKAVSDDVKALGYRLKIYDAYRPQKGVDHFVRWAEDINDTLMKPYFYPDLDKSVLFPQDYICLKSGHTRGSTLDLTLFDMNTEKEVDMGGTFDWFDPESHPDFCGNPETGEYTGNNSKSPTNPKRSITPEQFQNRMILRQAMLRHGFKPFDTEWWHFTLKDEPFPDTYFTFPVKQLSVRPRGIQRHGSLSAKFVRTPNCVMSYAMPGNEKKL